jgi:hypothetical protein
MDFLINHFKKSEVRLINRANYLVPIISFTNY